MQHRRHAGLLDEHVRDPLEPLAVDAHRQRLALRVGGAHRGCPLLELASDPVRLDRLLMAVPADALDTDLRHVPAEAAVAVEEGRPCAGAGRGERGTEPARTAANDEDVSLVDDLDLAGRLMDRGHPTRPRLPGRQSRRANTGDGRILTRTGAPGARSAASAADICAATISPLGSSTWVRETEPRKLTATTRASAESS